MPIQVAVLTFPTTRNPWPPKTEKRCCVLRNPLYISESSDREKCERTTKIKALHTLCFLVIIKVCLLLHTFISAVCTDSEQSQ
jgi:hypothetical protein